jgi:acetyltransferase-like isoleucine patch superfamily enzyme
MGREERGQVQIVNTALRVFRVLQFIKHQIHAKLDPIGYARSIGVTVGNNVTFYGMPPNMFGTEPWLITIGNNVYITAGCQFITHDGATLILRQEVPDLEITAPIIVGDDVYIGLRTMILPGVKIGNRCIIGAGSVVTKSIPDGYVAAGVPARVLKSTSEYLKSAQSRSLHFGHLSAKTKALALKKHFGVRATK